MDQEEIQSALTPFESWRPNPRQEDFLQVPYLVFEVLYGGALGGGKTDALIVAPIVLRTKNDRKQLYEVRDFTGIIFRRTFPQLEKKVIPRAKSIYGSNGLDGLGATYNETKKCFTFPSGAKIFLGHMEKESDVIKYDTDEYQYIGIDQAEQFTEYQLRYISSRIRTSNPNLPTILRMAANPGGESHVYLRDRFVKPAPNGNVLLTDKITGNKRIYIPAKLTDNPALMQNDPDYINRLMLLPEKEREAKMNGDWFSFAGAVFGELRVEKFPGEPEQALHVIPPFTIPDYWPRLLAIDWGYSAWTFAIWGALSPEGRLYIYRTYRVKKTNISHWAADVGRLSFGEKISRLPLDPSAWQQRGYELTLADEFARHSGLIPEKADNDRHSGVSLIHEYLRFTPKPAKKVPAENYDRFIAERILRVSGLEAHNLYLDSFKEEALETNLPKLQFFRGETENLISALQSAQYDERDKEDYAEFDGDDPIDCLRYLLKASSIYLESSSRLQDLTLRQDKIVKSLQETGDMTSFYMQMESLDSKRESTRPKPVKRYH